MSRQRLESDGGRVRLLWVDHPVYERHDKPYKWLGLFKRRKPWGVLLLPCTCYYTIEGVCYRDTVQMDYEWDGASVPRLLWPAGGHPFGHDLEAAGLFHDVWYGTRAIPRRDVDTLFGLIIEYFGGEEIHRKLAVEIFGWAPWSTSTAKELAYAAGFLDHHIIPCKEIPDGPARR